MDTLTMEDLLELGWELNRARGVETRTFTSVSFCLLHDGHQRVCVQGFGRTRDEAWHDATNEANTWLRRNHVERPE